jgi:hypothetical protein
VANSPNKIALFGRPARESNQSQIRQEHRRRFCSNSFTWFRCSGVLSNVLYLLVATCPSFSIMPARLRLPQIARISSSQLDVNRFNPATMRSLRCIFESVNT